MDSLQEAQEPSGKVSEVKERSGGNEVGEVKQVRAVSEEAHGYKKPMCGGGEGSPLLKKNRSVSQATAQHYESIWKFLRCGGKGSPVR